MTNENTTPEEPEDECIEPDSRIVLAQAIHELAAATRLRTEQRTTKLTVMTPSSGGELQLEWDSTMTDDDVSAYITKELARRESTLKACVKQNSENGIGVKKEGAK